MAQIIDSDGIRYGPISMPGHNVKRFFEESAALISPTRGTIFAHKHFLDPNTRQPLRCKVTAVRAGLVYYRPFYGTHEDGSDWLGSSWHVPLEKWNAEHR